VFSHDLQALFTGRGHMNMIIPPEGGLKTGQVILFIVDVEYGIYGI
jgi:hypothetical protein